MQKQLRSMGGNLDFDQGFADGRIRYVQNGSIRDSLDWNHNLRLAAQSHDWQPNRMTGCTCDLNIGLRRLASTCEKPQKDAGPFGQPTLCI